jgi:hypothetical protein
MYAQSRYVPSSAQDRFFFHYRNDPSDIPQLANTHFRHKSVIGIEVVLILSEEASTPYQIRTYSDDHHQNRRYLLLI